MMSWKDRLGQANTKLAANAGNVADEILTQYIPKIRQFLAETVGSAIVAAARDDETMIVCIKMAYGRLPSKVRWIVREKALIRFCLKHRDKLLPNGSLGAGILIAPPEGAISTPPPLPVSATEGTSYGCDVSRPENLQ